MAFNRSGFAGVAALCCLLSASPVFAQIPLQNATATFSQTFTGDFSAARAINGTTADDRGWAIFDTNAVPGNETSPQTAVFETVSDAGIAGGTQLTFSLIQTFSDQGHTIGRFRLSLTTDDRATFADGLQTGGDVTANWTVLTPSSLLSANGTTLTTLGDSSILASGTNPGIDTYTITATTALTGITGFRIEVLADASLPTNGPGRFPTNGNFVLSEFTVSQAAITVGAPETSPLALLFLAGPVAAYALRRTWRA